MAYIYPGPGSVDKQVVLKIRAVSSDATRYTEENLSIPALQDITVNAANDVFTWTQLDSASKLQIATTATNSLGMNLVLEQPIFFGKGSTTHADEATAEALGTNDGVAVGDFVFLTDVTSWAVVDTVTTSTCTVQIVPEKPVAVDGIFGVSTAKTRIEFELYLGDTSNATEGKFISSTGYITGLAPTVSADAPVWVSPITITIDDDYTIADTEQNAGS